MGPIALFDKSFLQSLSLDESVWFDHLFGPVVCPLFFAEALADLAKTPREGKSALEEVSVIASKTPEWSGIPCYYHQHLCMWDLLGRAVPMTGQVPVAARGVVRDDGRFGAVADYPPEAQAFARWNRRQFTATEHLFASRWRERVLNSDLNGLRSAMKSRGIGPKTCKTLVDARRYAEWCVTAMGDSLSRLDAAMETLGVHSEARPEIRDRWKRAGRPPIRTFAPYAAHVLCVEAFFAIGIAAHLIAAERPSNRIDVAYLFYLPFCHIFVSGDKLHRTCAPHFLRADQEFVWAHDLKADLQSIDSHYKAQPDTIRSLPIYKLIEVVAIPQGITRQLHATFAPNNISGVGADMSQVSQESHEKLLEEMNGWRRANPLPVDVEVSEERLEGFALERFVTKQRALGFKSVRRYRTRCSNSAGLRKIRITGQGTKHQQCVENTIQSIRLANSTISFFDPLSKMTTTRTLGPLHFEDLDPKRFEDLARQLIYDFKPWRKLEATGRAGSDDGFDARGYEMLSSQYPANAAPPSDMMDDTEASEDSDGALTAGFSDRLWLVQCKRERAIGPRKLSGYIDDIVLAEGERLHGVVLTAACDFSKKARDVFAAKCRELGIEEWHLWGKAELEDKLFQPQNDHLLFAYFGISLSIRRRSLRTELRAKLVMKRKAARLLQRYEHAYLLLRPPEAVTYPDADGVRDSATDEPPWGVRKYKEINHLGLVFCTKRYFAYLDDDGKHWDAAMALNQVRASCFEDPWRRDDESEDSLRQHASIYEKWNGLPGANRAWLEVLGVLPFEDVIDIDELGDEYFKSPHIYAQFHNRDSGPFRGFYVKVETTEGGDARTLYLDDAELDRVEVFPKEVRGERQVLGQNRRPREPSI